MHSWNHLQLLSCCVYSLSAAVGGSCVAVWATTLYTRICGERFKKLGPKAQRINTLGAPEGTDIVKHVKV